MEPNEIKSLIDEQGKAFEAWKQTFEKEMKGRDGNDKLLDEKLSRMEKSMDDAIEAKNRLEAAIAAERKEREALEAKLNREDLGAGSDEARAAALELKEFNNLVGSIAASRGRRAETLDAKGYGEYKAALDVFLRDGKEALSPDEVKTLSVGSDPDGGYFVTPDMSGRIVTKVYESSPMRQIASVQAITTDALEGIEDLGEAGAAYAGENSAPSNSTTPQVGKWKIPVWWIATEPKATQQLLDDSAVDIGGWLEGKIGDKFARFENAEFVAGDDGKIIGFTSVPNAADSGAGVAWGSVGYVNSGANGDFAASNPANQLFDLVGLLKDEYLANARWATRRSVITKVRKFKDTTGQFLWQPALTAGQPETLLGYAISRMEDMPALATGSISMSFGDFARAYQIVDRQGIRVMRDPYTAKPYIKFYTTKRTGGGVLNFEAIKHMRFAA